jgi:hypothetical protein
MRRVSDGGENLPGTGQDRERGSSLDISLKIALLPLGSSVVMKVQSRLSVASAFGMFLLEVFQEHRQADSTKNLQTSHHQLLSVVGLHLHATVAA